MVNSDEFVEAVERHHDRNVAKAIYHTRFNLPHGGEAYRLTYAAPNTGLMVITDLLAEIKVQFSITGGRAAKTGDAHFDGIVEELERHGFTMATGYWAESSGMAADPAVTSGSRRTAADVSDYFVASVAYITADNEAGIWVDAFPDQPGEKDVLQTMYREFVSSGDLEGTTFEQFVDGASPTVEVRSSAEIADWVTKKGGR